MNFVKEISIHLKNHPMKKTGPFVITPLIRSVLYLYPKNLMFPQVPIFVPGKRRCNRRRDIILQAPFLLRQAIDCISF